MAVPKKFLVVPNAATRELWRISESGELDELLPVLPAADVNARNEHGMTALMRAARQGRVQMVRTLLAHGADPNLERNDKFTALSLAAFFGHTEIVELLIQHGAQTDIRTRQGTSPKMWATARSFGDIARCLEKRTEVNPPVLNRPVANVFEPREAVAAQPRVANEPVANEPVASEPVAPVAAPIVVRTLKDPPEIWDLVHEAPRHFNARSAFVARLSSMKTASLIALAALIVAVGLGSAAALKWKGWLPLNTAATSHGAAPAKPTTVAPPATTTASEAPAATTTAATVTPPETNQVESPPEVPVVTLSADTTTYAPRRSRSFARSRPTSSEIESVNTIENAPAPKPPAINLNVDSQRADDSATKNKPTAPLSPQMITPAKNAPPKGKVIQWP